jgi:hypothetical protein
MLMMEEKHPEPLKEILKRFNEQYGIKDEDLKKASDESISKNTDSAVSVAENTESVVDAANDFSEDDADENNDGHDIDPSAFDLNFSEFPIAHLTNRLPKGVSKTAIQYTDWITGVNGKKVERKWTVRSNAVDKNEKLIGIGGPSSLKVFYEIIQIWKEQGIKEDKIYIGTYYNLLKRLGWGTGGKDYTQLDDDLRSIFDLKIEAENAYYDKEQNRYVNWIFKPFTGWKLFKKNEIEDYMTDYGYIKVDSEFYESFRKKSMYYLPFEAEFFHQLSSHEQKLAFYLTKIFNPYRKKVQFSYTRNIDELCNQLPIYGDIRKRKFYLIKACEGLIKRKYILLENFTVTDNTITLFNRQQMSLLPYLKVKAGIKPKIQIDLLLEDILKVCGDTHSKNFYTLIAKYVPDGIIYETLSEAKQEGKPPRKLFTAKILERAGIFLNPFVSKKINKSNSNIDAGKITQLSKEEMLEIEKELIETDDENINDNEKYRIRKKTLDADTIRDDITNNDSNIDPLIINDREESVKDLDEALADIPEKK